MQGRSIAMNDLDAEPRPSRWLWFSAALGALVLHVGGAALAVAHLRIAEPDDALGAPAIEIGLELASPHLEPADLPPGPDTEASVASLRLPSSRRRSRRPIFLRMFPLKATIPTAW